MIVGNTESAWGTLRRLWKKAPAWRLVGLSAATLALLFAITLSDRPAPQEAPLAKASYVPQPAASPPVPPVIAAPAVPATVPRAPSVIANAPPAVAQPVIQTARLALAVPAATASPDGLDSAIAGRHFNGSVRVDGFDVQLPEGDWLLLANLHFKVPYATGEELLLGRIKSRRLIGITRITAARSTNTPGQSFPKVQGCVDHTQNDNYVYVEEVVPGDHQACWNIDHFFTPPLTQWADRTNKLPPLERMAAGDLAGKGVTYPQDLVSVKLTRSETWGLVEVRYVFSPEEEHITSHTAATYLDSDWQPGNIESYPEKLAYIDKLKRWGTVFWPRFKDAFDKGQNHVD